MIGSIGAESRYSTGYNNLKPNRNQNKWADTLAQTVDKEDISSRADINRAKKSTVMDSYLALSGKTKKIQQIEMKKLTNLQKRKKKIIRS